jgi:hypothetical protein
MQRLRIGQLVLSLIDIVVAEAKGPSLCALFHESKDFFQEQRQLCCEARWQLQVAAISD